MCEKRSKLDFCFEQKRQTLEENEMLDPRVSALDDDLDDIGESSEDEDEPMMMEEEESRRRDMERHYHHRRRSPSPR